MRKCSFCAASASTKEDAWPNWLARKFPSPAGVEIEGQRGRQPTLRWTSQRHALRVGAVCGSCNNGWMSDLENLAKAVIEPLLRSHQYLFASAEKRNLARWTLKSAMVFESLGVRREPFYTQYERDAVRAGELPPGYHALWVGRCVDLNGLYCNAADLFDHREPSLSDTTGYVTTLGIGPIALQMLSIRLRDGVPAPARVSIPLSDGPWNEVGSVVWPDDQRAEVWSPTRALNGEYGLDTLSRRFRTEPA